MKKNHTFLIIALVLNVATASSQPLRSSRVVAGFDIGMGFDQKKLMPSLEFYQLLKIDKRGVFQAGYRVGFTRFMSQEINLTSKQADTLQMRQTSAMALNFGLKAQISLKRLDLGVSADLFGFSFGGQRTGYYLSSKAFNKIDSLNLNRTLQTARPGGGNLQLIDQNNAIGNLNTDVYARVWLSQRVGLKVGYVFNLTQYRTDRALLNDQRRFGLESRLIYVGVAIALPN